MAADAPACVLRSMESIPNVDALDASTLTCSEPDVPRSVFETLPSRVCVPLNSVEFPV